MVITSRSSFPSDLFTPLFTDLSICPEGIYEEIQYRDTPPQMNIATVYRDRVYDVGIQVRSAMEQKYIKRYFTDLNIPSQMGYGNVYRIASTDEQPNLIECILGYEQEMDSIEK